MALGSDITSLVRATTTDIGVTVPGQKSSGSLRGSEPSVITSLVVGRPEVTIGGLRDTSF